MPVQRGKAILCPQSVDRCSVILFLFVLFSQKVGCFLYLWLCVKMSGNLGILRTKPPSAVPCLNGLAVLFYQDFSLCAENFPEVWSKIPKRRTTDFVDGGSCKICISTSVGKSSAKTGGKPQDFFSCLRRFQLLPCAHNQEVAGSNPVPATRKTAVFVRKRLFLLKKVHRLFFVMHF